jgi:CheY-like chemotaxis protein
MSAQKTKLLLVDDDAALLYLLSLILTNSGYEVRSAQDGFSALTAIRAEIPDILLSDLYMPGMSGFELLSVVRRRFPMIPVIAMSSAYPGPDVPAGVAADAFYEKATDLNALMGIVNGIHYLPDGQAPSQRSAVMPMWIARKMDGSEDANISLACPECMRTFAQLRAGSESVVHEAHCPYCSNAVSYAVVRSASAVTPNRLLRGGGPQVQYAPAPC